MAFTPTTLLTAASVMNATGYGDASAIHTYRSADTLSEIGIPGYFPDFFNVDPEQVRVNDILAVMASDLRLFTIITDLSPVTLVAFSDFPSNIVTDLDTTQSNELTGVWAAPISIMLDFYQQNKECIVTFPSVSADATGGGGGPITLTSPFIAAAFPQYEIFQPIIIQNGTDGNFEAGECQLLVDGTIAITRAAGSFGTTANAGFKGFSIAFKTI